VALVLGTAGIRICSRCWVGAELTRAHYRYAIDGQLHRFRIQAESFTIVSYCARAAIMPRKQCFGQCLVMAAPHENL